MKLCLLRGANSRFRYLDDVLEMYYYKSDIPNDNEYTITIKNKFTDELHSIVKLKN